MDWSLAGISMGGSTSFNFLPAQTMQCTCQAQYSSCNGATYIGATGGATWSSSNTAVATMDASTKGLVHAVAAGTATISAQINGDTYYFGRYCIATAVTRTGSETTNVYQPYQVAAIGTSSSGKNVNCSAGTGGYVRWATLQLQNQAGNPIPIPNIQMHDTIQVGKPNDLGLGTPVTGTTGTDSNGSWLDEYFFSCTSVCATYSSVPETDALQYWTYNGLALPHVNAVIYKCVSIKVDGR